VVLSESIVIDQYLAKKFNLLGDNEWEEWAIKTHYSNIHYLRERSLMKLTWTWADKRKEALDVFLEKTLPDFIVDHEFHLRRNGSNGHYVGDRVSWRSLTLICPFWTCKLVNFSLPPPLLNIDATDVLI
jgi:glutathione S-transferase